AFLFLQHSGVGHLFHLRSLLLVFGNETCLRTDRQSRRHVSPGSALAFKSPELLCTRGTEQRYRRELLAQDVSFTDAPVKERTGRNAPVPTTSADTSTLYGLS